MLQGILTVFSTGQRENALHRLCRFRRDRGPFDSVDAALFAGIHYAQDDRSWVHLISTARKRHSLRAKGGTTVRKGIRQL